MSFVRNARSAQCGLLTERVCLPLGSHVCSAERKLLSGCGYHLAGMRSASVYRNWKSTEGGKADKTAELRTCTWGWRCRLALPAAPAQDPWRREPSAERPWRNFRTSALQGDEPKETVQETSTSHTKRQTRATSIL